MRLGRSKLLHQAGLIGSDLNQLLKQCSGSWNSGSGVTASCTRICNGLSMAQAMIVRVPMRRALAAANDAHAVVAPFAFLVIRSASPVGMDCYASCATMVLSIIKPIRLVLGNRCDSEALWS